MAKVIAFANRKGGVAKTTSCLCTAFWLADRGKRVLMIDNDSQANLTEFFRYDPDELEDQGKTIYYGYLGKAPLSTLIIRENPALIPSSDHLSDAELELMPNTFVDRGTVLKSKLKELEAQYDYILIDCPPSLDMLTINACTAAASVVIPMATDRFAKNGVMRLVGVVENTRKRLNPDLGILGILPTRYTAGYVNDRKNLEQVRAFADRMGIRILDPIKRGTIFNTESADETSPDRIRPDQQAVEAYAPLGEEILA